MAYATFDTKNGSFPQDNDDLCTLLWSKLSLGDHDSIDNTLEEERSKSYFSHNSLKLVPAILRALYEDFCSDETEESIEKILLTVAYEGHPKETLMAILEQIEVCPSDRQLRVLLRPLQHVLLRRIPPPKRSRYVSWAFNAIYSHISALELPEELALEGEEIKLLDCHPDVVALYNSLKYVSKFILPFHQKILSGELDWVGKVGTSRENFAFYLIKYLNSPFSNLDVYNDGVSTPSAAYDLCSKFVTMINELLVNPLKTLEYVMVMHPNIPIEEEESENAGGTNDSSDPANGSLLANKDDDPDDPKSLLQVSLGTYYYCLFSQNIGISAVPTVYSSVYLYLKCLSCCLFLFREVSDLPTQKALLLMKALMEKVPEKMLDMDSFEIKDLLEIPKALSYVMIHSQNQNMRQDALAIFKVFVKKFNDEAQMFLYHNLLSYRHSGFVGLLIHDLKENVARDLKLKKDNSPFLGDNLKVALLLICSPPDTEKEQFLDYSDKILATLNLVLFLLLCDKEKISGIHEILPTIHSEYLEPLHSKITDNKNELKACLLEVERNPSYKKENCLNFYINKQRISSLHPQQEMDTIKSSLTWLDLIESIWAKVENLIRTIK